MCACVGAYEYAGRDLEAGTSAFQVGNMHVFSTHIFKMHMTCCEMHMLCCQMQMLFGYAFLQKKSGQRCQRELNGMRRPKRGYRVESRL